MRTRIAFMLAAGLSLGSMQIASAADMPVKAPVYKAMPAVVAYNWTGCYVGANAGWGHAKHDLSTAAHRFPANNINATARTAIIKAGAASLDGDGFTGGGQVGCNWQLAGTSFVLGGEGDFNFLSAKASRDTGNVVEPVSGRVVRSIDDIGMDWFATIRGRIGFAIDRILIYGTGGVAFAKIDISKRFAWNFNDACPVVGGLNECHAGGDNSTRTGWTAGGGVEWAFDNHWSAKAEYLYADFGDVTYQTSNVGPAFVGAPQVASHTVSTTLQIARLGINYRF